METILVADDEPRIRRMLRDYLVTCNYNVMEAEDGKQVLDRFYHNNGRIDMILLDVMMPYKDGYQVLKEIREVSEVPIIMMTAKNGEYDQLISFRYGVDDFIGKPFSPVLLAAHVKAVLKRCRLKAGNTVTVGKIRFDAERRQIEVNGEILDLTPREYDLLLFFLNHTGMVFTREQILDAIWNFDYGGDLRTVDTHVKQLRAKLKDHSTYIKTIYGVGYKFEI